MFVRVDLVRPFTPVESNAVYGMERLLDMALYPKAESVTMYAITDSAVQGSPMTVWPVGNDVPDPGNGVVRIQTDRNQVTTPNKFTKLVLSVEMAKAAFPFLGVLFETGPTAPSQGRCWAYADIWWPGEV